MTLEELQGKVPESFRPWVAAYGPAILAMTAEELKAWIDLLIQGDVFAAYEKLLTGMENAAVLADWATLKADWQAANITNADRLELQRSAVVAVLKIGLAVALAAVGL